HRRHRRRDPRVEIGHGVADQSRVRALPDGGLRGARHGHARADRRYRRDGEPRRATRPAVDGVSATVRVRGLQTASVLRLLASWAAVVRAGWVDPLFVPAPSAVIRGFGLIAPTALSALGDTLLKTAIAYALAAALGVTTGVVLGSVRALHDALHPFVVAV